MKDILLEYYTIDAEYIQNGYFIWNNERYYIMRIDSSFFEVFSYYDYMIRLLGLKGYRIIKNRYGNVSSKNYILFQYQIELVELKNYFYISLKPIWKYQLSIHQIKESWIEKIDCVRKEVSKYSYSFQYNRDLNALIHYYCGMAENGINILNEILLINKHSSIYLSLSLIKDINPCFYELMNPGYYTISTRAKHIIHLLSSGVLSFGEFEYLISEIEFDNIELLYIYARSFYNSEFFDFVLNQKCDEKNIVSYLDMSKKDKEFINKMRKTIGKYITLPEIGWIK